MQLRAPWGCDSPRVLSSREVTQAVPAPLSHHQLVMTALALSESAEPQQWREVPCHTGFWTGVLSSHSSKAVAPTCRNSASSTGSLEAWAGFHFLAFYMLVE